MGRGIKMSETERAYLSIIEWPEASDEDWRADALATVGIDTHQARLAVRQAAPMVVALINAGQRAAVLQGLRNLGVLAVAPTRTELARLPTPINAKRLAEAMGSDGQLYMVEPWRGESEGLRTEDIRLLVRASVRASKTSVTSDPTAGRSAAYGYMAAGPEGAAVGAMDSFEHGSNRSTKIKTSELLDIYTSDKRRIRINGDKFAFDCLGDQRSFTDKVNLDTLTVRLAELAPKAYIDQAFDKFRPPADIVARSERSGGGSVVRSRNDQGAFDFYSPWFAIVYSVLLKNPKR